jgi:hypothetical protein
MVSLHKGAYEMQDLADYATAIMGLPPRDHYRQEDILTQQFQLEAEGLLTSFYAPFDYINCAARVALVGITPGWTQTEVAYRIARASLAAGESIEDASRKAKHAASFAGSTRANLVRMLDDLGLPSLLGIESSSVLFDTSSPLCHMTSVFRYPIFKSGKDYGGWSPLPRRSQMLMRMAHEIFVPELLKIPSAVIVPLGGAVDGVLSMLEDEGISTLGRRLVGFPHPSGQNRLRARYFEERRVALRQILKEAFKREPG